MFFDRPTAIAQLEPLQSHLRPGGHAVVNVLVEGTTWLEMLDPSAHCLFGRGELARHFHDWTIVLNESSEYPGERRHDQVVRDDRRAQAGRASAP